MSSAGIRPLPALVWFLIGATGAVAGLLPWLVTGPAPPAEPQRGSVHDGDTDRTAAAQPVLPRHDRRAAGRRRRGGRDRRARPGAPTAAVRHGASRARDADGAGHRSRAVRDGDGEPARALDARADLLGCR